MPRRRHALLTLQLWAAFAALSLALGGALLTAHQLAARHSASVERVRRTHEVLLGIRGLLNDLLDIETGSRGYLVSGSEQFLEPYVHALRVTTAHQAELRTLTRDDPGQQRRLDVLDAQIAAKQAFTGATVEARRLHGYAVARSMLASGRGKALMDAVRRSAADLEAEERRLLARRLAEEHADDQRAERTRWLVAALLVLACGGGFVAIRRQLVARAEVEAALAASQERFQHAADGTSDGIWDWDVRRGTLYLSAPWKAMLGYGPDELSPAPDEWVQRVHPDDRERAQAAVADHLAGRTERLVLEHRLRHRDGSYRWILSRAIARRDADGSATRMVGTHTDLTERRQLEEALAVRSAELARSNAALERFATAASHDLQEPLRRIQAFGSRLASRHAGALDAAGRDYLGRMQAAAARMQALLDDLLGYARVRAQGRPFADVDVEQLARTVVRELEGGSLPDGTQLAVSGAGSTLPPVVHADSPQLRLLVEQLLDNALKFRGEQRPARVHVNVTRAPGDGGAGDVVRLTVRDEGIGFDERFLDRIFAPFQRLHGRDAYGGTGMGLALCQHVVERHGGTLTAHSSPGSGATFTATLPAAAPAPSAA